MADQKISEVAGCHGRTWKFLDRDQCEWHHVKDQEVGSAEPSRLNPRRCERRCERTFWC